MKSFVSFEKQWLPILMYLDLWRQQEGLEASKKAMAAEGGDDDIIMLTPPNARSSFTATMPLSGSSTAPFNSGSSSATRAVSSSSAQPATAAAASRRFSILVARHRLSDPEAARDRSGV
jgi:hypothetical protein